MTTADNFRRGRTGGDPDPAGDSGPIDRAAFLASVSGPGTTAQTGADAPTVSTRPTAGGDWKRGVVRHAAETRRPAWHAVETPEPVGAAWSAVEAASATLQAAIDRVLVGVEADEDAEAAALEREVRDAVRQGRSPKPEPRRDWHLERAMALEQYRQVLGNFHAARSAYSGVVAQALPAWRRRLIDVVARRRAAAAEALAGVLPLVAEARRAHSALRMIAEEISISDAADASTMPSNVSAMAAAGREGAEAAHAWLTSDHPALTGEAYGPDSLGVGPQPPLHVREVQWERGQVSHLAPVEAAEGWQVTAYTWDSRHVYAAHAREHGHGDVSVQRNPPAGSIGY